MTGNMLGQYLNQVVLRLPEADKGLKNAVSVHTLRKAMGFRPHLGWLGLLVTGLGLMEGGWRLRRLVTAFGYGKGLHRADLGILGVGSSHLTLVGAS